MTKVKRKQMKLFATLFLKLVHIFCTRDMVAYTSVFVFHERWNSSKIPSTYRRLPIMCFLLVFGFSLLLFSFLLCEVTHLFRCFIVIETVSTKFIVDVAIFRTLNVVNRALLYTVIKRSIVYSELNQQRKSTKPTAQEKSLFELWIMFRSLHYMLQSKYQHQFQSMHSINIQFFFMKQINFVRLLHGIFYRIFVTDFC